VSAGINVVTVHVNNATYCENTCIQDVRLLGRCAV
jgi:hypothetical protein